MSDAEIARLQETLRLKLPAEYLAVARRVAAEVEGLRGPLGKGLHRPLLWSGVEALEVNLLVRRTPAFYCVAPEEFAGGWPDHYLVCGYERAGVTTYVLDCRASVPAVFQVLAKSKTLEPCTTHSTLAALAEYALAKYREFGSKHARKFGKGKPAPDRPAKPKPAAVPPAPAAPADVRAVEAMAQLLRQAGFEFAPPRRAHSIEALIGDIVPALPSELHALYTACDGGRCQRLNLRLLPLTEAARTAQAYLPWHPAMRYMPFLDSPATDPCCVATAGPLAGYVIFAHHDGPDAVLARSLSAFFRVLAATQGGAGWNLEDAMFQPRSPQYEPFEFAGPHRSAADVHAARALMRLGEQDTDGEGDRHHLFVLALQLLSGGEKRDIEALGAHADPEIRRLAQARLAQP